MKERVNIIRKNTHDVLQKKYFQVMQLLDDFGPWALRLDLVHKIVSTKGFSYDESKNPLPFLYTFLHSAYWLDKELFDTRVVRQRYFRSNLTGEQQVHMRLLDIGCILIKKGFPLDKIVSNQTKESNPTDNWACAFLKQCHERHAFLVQYRCSHQSRSYKATNKNEHARV